MVGVCNTAKAIKETVRGIGDFHFPSFLLFLCQEHWEDASAQQHQRCAACIEISVSIQQRRDLYLTAVTGRKGPLYLLFNAANTLTFIMSLTTCQSSAGSWSAASKGGINACWKSRNASEGEQGWLKSSTTLLLPAHQSHSRCGVPRGSGNRGSSFPQRISG